MKFTANCHKTRFDIHNRLDHIPELETGHVSQHGLAYGISNNDDFQGRHQLILENFGTARLRIPHPLQSPRSNPNLLAEGVGIRSRPERLLAPARGPGPLAPARGAGHPLKGAHPLQNPRSNPNLLAEGVGIRSRPERLLAPARGAGPLAPARGAGHPMKGAHPLQNPRSNPTPFYSC